MTRRREVVRALHGLADIRDIMGAMRTLAMLETRRLARAVDAQAHRVDAVRAATQEVLAHFPVAGRGERVDDVLVVLGSERGFCGDFNGALLRFVADFLPTAAADAFVVIGNRVAGRLELPMAPIAVLAGPTTLEEVAAVVIGLTGVLRRRRGSTPLGGPIRLTLIHQRLPGGVCATTLDPLAEARRSAPRHGSLAINLPPADLLASLAEHYVFAVLHQIFFASLLAENDLRMRHMDRAQRRLDERCERLARERNALRQEEITQEIEVMTLGAI
jgi:F-type H+-transporting ATPase subunit gamma